MCLAKESGAGTKESRRFRDNLWELKSEAAICLDHRARRALLIPLQLSSAHTLSIYGDKTPPERSAVAHFITPQGFHRAARSLKLSSASSPRMGVSSKRFLSVTLVSAHRGQPGLHHLESMSITAGHWDFSSETTLTLLCHLVPPQ